MNIIYIADLLLYNNLIGTHMYVVLFYYVYINVPKTAFRPLVCDHPYAGHIPTFLSSNWHDAAD